jgi:hypothetical protein
MGDSGMFRRRFSAAPALWGWAAPSAFFVIAFGMRLDVVYQMAGKKSTAMKAHIFFVNKRNTFLLP